MNKAESHSSNNKPLPLSASIHLSRTSPALTSSRQRKKVLLCSSLISSSSQVAKKPSGKLHNARARLLLHPPCHHCFAVYGLQCVNMEHSSLVHDRAELDFDTLEAVK